MKKIIFLFFLLASSFAFCDESFHADVVVKPGDTGSIVFPVKNSSLSLEAMEEVEVEVGAPDAPYFIVQDTSLFTTGSISVGETFLSKIDYKIETNAPHGEFDVVLGVHGTNSFIPVDGISTSVCTIKVSCMEVVVTPVLSAVTKDESGDYVVTVKNFCSSTEQFKISLLSKTRSDWSVSDVTISDFILQSGEEIILDFSVYNSYAISPIEIVVMVEIENRGSPEEVEIIVESGQEHKNDHPDDTHAITSSDYPSSWLYDSKADIGVFAGGWGIGLSYFAGKYDIATCVVKSDLTIINEPSRSLNDLKVLLIGSAAFAGMEQSQVFRQKLEDYVSAGGTLIMFTQQHGYEFQVLPGGEVFGYGWSEDQSCHGRAAYIDTYHVMFAGQDSAMLDASVDGYFTEWPTNATILLRRTKNAMPAMIMYEYGAGRVIASSLYSDWAYGNAGLTQDEYYLIRDLLTWSENPIEISEGKPDQPLNLMLPVTNYQTNNATGVVVTVYEPDRDLAATYFFDCELEYRMSTNIDLTNLVFSALGIYQLNYELLGGDEVIQSELASSERFAVSHHLTGYAPSPISFSVQSDSENYLWGNNAEFTFLLWNNSESNRKIKVYYFFPNYEGNSLEKTLVVPARGQVSFTYIVPVYKDDWLWVDFYDEAGLVLGRASRGFAVRRPSARIDIETDKVNYKRGQTVGVSLDIRNEESLVYDADVQLTIIGPDQNSVFEDSFTTNLMGNSLITHAYSFILNDIALLGMYQINVNVSRLGEQTAVGTGTFDVPRLKVLATPDLPEVFVANAINSVGFVLDNVGMEYVSGSLAVTLKAPDGATLWAGDNAFTNIPENESTSLVFPVMINAIRFGTYRLEYVLTYGGKSTVGHVNVPCSARMELVCDQTAYHIGEVIGLNLVIKNIGLFRQDMAAAIEISDCQYQSTSNVTLLPGQAEVVRYDVLIPQTVNAGVHLVNAELLQENTLTQMSTFTIYDSSIVINLSGTNFIAGTGLDLAIINNGGVGTTFSCAVDLVGSQGNNLIHSVITNVLSAGELLVNTFAIPEGAVNGTYLLTVNGINQETGEALLWQRNITVSGLNANLKTETDKIVYKHGQVVTSTTTISNYYGNIMGTLDMRVVRQPLLSAFTQIEAECLDNTFSDGVINQGVVTIGGVPVCDALLEGGANFVEFKKPTKLTVDVDGNVYITDTDNHQIQKFDSDGNLITKWGSQGSGIGQFNAPCGIAADLSGHIYIIDSGNYRIQKFTTDGTFVMQWGSRGGDDGQFRSPSDVVADTMGNVYVVEGGEYNFYSGRTGLDRVQKFTSEGVFIMKWGRWGSDNGSFDGARGIAVDSSGMVYVADTGNHRIQKFNAQGGFVATWGIQGLESGKFNSPYDVSVESTGNIFVLDTGNHRIQKLSSSGTFLTEFGVRGSENNQFESPQGLGLGSKDQIYVSDTGNHRVQKLMSSDAKRISLKVPDIAVSGTTIYMYYGNHSASSSSRMWDNVKHLNIYGGVFDYGASLGIDGFYSMAMQHGLGVSAGQTHTCVLRSDGTVKAYGDNYYGQSEDYMGGDAVAIGVGDYHNLILKSDSNVHAYGYNYYGQAEDYVGGDAIGVAGGGVTTCHSCILKRDGTVVCYGNNSDGQAENYVGGDAVGVAAGGWHTAVLTSHGNVHCFGGNGDGQSEDYVGGDAIGVAAGGWHTAVLTSHGNVYCFGDNGDGQSEDYVGGDAIGVAAGAVSTCILKSNGNVLVYGRGATEYIGGDAIGVSAGDGHFCVLTANGDVLGFGGNYYGQAEDYIFGNAKNPFRKYVALAPIASIGAETAGYSASFSNSGGDLWTYRKPISITGSTSNLTDYQVSFVIDPFWLIFSNKLQSDMGDLRFTGSDETTEIPYWIGGVVTSIVEFVSTWGTYGTGRSSFSAPRGVAVNSSDELYVVDTGNHRIQKFADDGTFICKWGKEGVGAGEFKYPQGITIDLLGNVYVADVGNCRIQKFSSSGNFLLEWGSYGSGDDQFVSPRGVVVDVVGNVYVVDKSNNRIQKFTSSGIFLIKWGSYGTEGFPWDMSPLFKYPEGIGVDSVGNVYVADTGNHRIQKFTPNGVLIQKWGCYGTNKGEFYDPRDVALGRFDSLYVVDSGIALGDQPNYSIQQFSLDGTFISEFGSYGAGVGECNSAYGVTVDSSGYIYVADTANNRIQKFRPPIKAIIETSWIQIGSPRKVVGFTPIQTLNGGTIIHEYKTEEEDEWQSIVEIFNETLSSGQVKFRSTLSRDEVTDPSPLFDKIIFSYTWAVATNVLWEESRNVIVAEGETRQIVSDIGVLDVTGKLYLKATLKSSGTGQIIARDIYPFYITDQDVALLLDTDKDVYSPGENVMITGAVLNVSDVSQSGLSLMLAKDEVPAYTEMFDLSVGQTHSFSTTMMADRPFVLSGSVGGVTVTNYVEVAHSYMRMTVDAPDIVGHQPFLIDVRLENFGNLVPADLVLSIGGRSTSLTLNPGETRLVQESFTVSQTTTFNIVLSGDKDEAVQKMVLFGENAVFAMSPEANYPEGDIEVPYSILNNGLLDTSVEVSFFLDTQLIQKSVYDIPKEGTVPGVMQKTLDAGQYTLSYQLKIDGTAILLDSGNINLDVKAYNQAKIESMTVHSDQLTPEGNILIDIRYKNVGYNEFVGRLRLSTGYYEDEIDLNLSVGEITTTTFAIPASFTAGSYEAKSQILYAGRLIDEKSQTFQLSAAYVFSEVPSSLEFAIEEVATISVRVKNEGSVGGLAYIYLVLADIVDDNQTAWLEVGEEKDFLFRFVVPDDLWTCQLKAECEIQNGENVQIPVSIKGYGVDVEASLDRKLYEEGDIARLTLKVRNESDLTSFLYAGAILNEYGEGRNFILPSPPLGIDITNTPGDVRLQWKQEVGPLGLVAYDGYQQHLINFTNNLDGTFAYAEHETHVAVPSTYSMDGVGLTDIDLNGDQLRDIVAYDGYNRRLIYFVNQGDGVFSYTGSTSFASAPSSSRYGGPGLATVDFNSDGIDDIVAYDGYNRTLMQFAGNGDSTFVYVGDVNYSSAPRCYYRNSIGLTALDINADGLIDIVSYDAYYKRLLQFMNEGDGTFSYQKYTSFPSSSASYIYAGSGMATVDLNSDGLLDIVSYNGYYRALQRFMNRGDGIFDYDGQSFYTDAPKTYYRSGVGLAACNFNYSEGYTSTGVLVSAVFDAEYIVTWGNINWASTQPTGTTIIVETRTSDDISTQAGWSLWERQENGMSVSSASAQYIQYRVTMITTDLFVTPILHDLTINSDAGVWTQSSQDDFDTESYVLEFDVPITFSGQDEIFYGVLLESGRSLYLGDIPIHEKHEGINLWTDKDVYAVGENVVVSIETTNSMTVTVVAPGYSNTMALASGITNFQFTLPLEMLSGKYQIEYSANCGTYSYNIDVAGYSLRVLESILNRDAYEPESSIALNCLVDASHAMDCIVRGWVIDAAGEYTDCFEISCTLEKGENIIDLTGIVATSVGGEAKLIYGFFKPIAGQKDELILAAGFEMFLISSGDDEPPLLYIVYPPDGIITNTNITIEYEVSDNVSEPVNIIISGDQSPYTYDGQYVVSLTAIDVAGNSTTSTVSFIIDKTAPVVDMGNDIIGDEGGPVILDASATYDPVPGTGLDLDSYLWGFGDAYDVVSGSGEQTQHTYNENGQYIATLTVADLAGNSATGTVNVQIANIAPVIELGVDIVVDEDASFSLTASVTDPGWLDSHIVAWDFGDGNQTTQSLNGSSVTIAYKYQWPGVYTVFATVQDDDGATDSDGLFVTVQDAVSPNAELLSPSPDSLGLCRIVNGIVTVMGLGNDIHMDTGLSEVPTPDNFAWYKLEYAEGVNATHGWHELLSEQTTPVLEPEALVTWNTTELASGYYTLKMTVAETTLQDNTTKPNISERTAVVYVGKPELVFEFGKMDLNKPSYLDLIELPDDDGTDIILLPDGQGGVTIVAVPDGAMLILVVDKNNDLIAVYRSDNTAVGTEHIFNIGEIAELGKGKKTSSIFNKPEGIVATLKPKADFSNLHSLEIYLSDQNNDRVLKLTETGVTEIGTSFNKPAGIVLDSAGTVLVADQNNDRLVVLDSGGVVIESLEALLNKPAGINLIELFGTDGIPEDVEIYVADRNNDRVIKLDAAGDVIGIVGEPGNGLGQFNKPMGVYVNQLGYMFVTDRNNDRLQKFDKFGNVVMVLDDAEFNKPVGIMLNSKGTHMYVVDQNNNRILVFGLPEE